MPREILGFCRSTMVFFCQSHKSRSADASSCRAIHHIWVNLPILSAYPYLGEFLFVFMFLYLSLLYFTAAVTCNWDERATPFHSLAVSTSFWKGWGGESIHIMVSSYLFSMFLYLILLYFTAAVTCNWDERATPFRSLAVSTSFWKGWGGEGIHIVVSSHSFPMFLYLVLVYFIAALTCNRDERAMPFRSFIVNRSGAHLQVWIWQSLWIPITNNGVIGGVLGECDNLSVEDLVHEIINTSQLQTGSYLISNPLCLTFICQASNLPAGGWRQRKFKHYIQHGDFSNRENNINMLIRRWTSLY
jgi:hypothetical protein